MLVVMAIFDDNNNDDKNGDDVENNNGNVNLKYHYFDDVVLNVGIALFLLAKTTLKW
jgi:hypothetical protein